MFFLRNGTAGLLSTFFSTNKAISFNF
jgi:hypothetical protein